MNTIKKYRNHLMSELIDLNLGDLEGVEELTTDELQSLVGDLKIAQIHGKLNLETEAGIENLQHIVDGYI